MGFFTRDKPKDTNALAAALDRGTLEEFLAVYDPAWVHYDGYSGHTLLTMALTNKDLKGRVDIANRLLDDAADVTRCHPLHVLVGQTSHDFPAEAQLLERMLDLGADVNEVSPKRGTPLEAAAARFQYSDRDLEPFYDVFLARPDIDLLAPGLDGRQVLVNLRKWYALRAQLVERAEALLTERGIPLPDPER